ncbi:histidine phosphatase super family protein [Rhodococcus sp. MTM3W5.2]|uniref:phosphoglycerate mutase family protein n=1 Tax=Rhodococcus sp. MTM3W5.2 TaxID=1805827 RepID=UPI0009794BCE|nr:phosphoglycerate mutase family protein [Rhodococcus sp. MTM3W5.2]AQA23133.1 histidine phosphatase super family protein [Rhodococcus sp. MTM3W5.2]
MADGAGPERIVLLRHGESEANIDPGIYERVPDYRIPLTARGVEQSRVAGERLREQFDGQKVCVYVSPYLRAYQTLEALGIDDLIERRIEEPRLREQDWANYQDPDEIARQTGLRNTYGHFFYRFNEGESGADVFDRVSTFMETLYRHRAKPGFPPNTLVVTHGLTMRLFCMRWFHWSVEYFESLNNPGNAETRTLVRQADGRFALEQPFDQWRAVPEGQTILDTTRAGVAGPE